MTRVQAAHHTRRIQDFTCDERLGKSIDLAAAPRGTVGDVLGIDLPRRGFLDCRDESGVLWPKTACETPISVQRVSIFLRDSRPMHSRSARCIKTNWSVLERCMGCVRSSMHPGEAVDRMFRATKKYLSAMSGTFAACMSHQAERGSRITCRNSHCWLFADRAESATARVWRAEGLVAIAERAASR